MKYKAVLYDMDGTVLDTLADLTDAVNHALAHFDLPQTTARRVRAALGNGAARLIAETVPQGTDAALIDEVLRYYKPYYDAHCNEKTAPYPGIIELMRCLNAAGVKQAVISNKPDNAVRQLADAFFPGLLELAVGESETVRRKPCPDAVNAAVAAMGLEKAECVYIGDTEVDILTAQNAAIDCIAVAWGFRDEEALKQAHAQTIVHTADELYAVLTGE